jgi:hypothetical protein
MKMIIKASQAAIILYTLFVTATSALAQRGIPQLAYHKPKIIFQSDIGEVFVAIIGVRPLDAVIDELQPQFNLTTEDALKEAVPNTLNSSESTLSSVNTALQIALFGLSKSTNSPSAASPLNVLSNLPNGSLGIDQLSAYKAGASLFEQVRLLNRSLKDVPHFKGYTPYIITIQIALIPYRRNTPYDAYTDLAFFTGNNQPPQPPDIGAQTIPLIFPLLTTDALETANDQQNQNQLRQLNLSIAAMLHSIGAQASLDRLSQNLDSANGLNLNSLFTVGKISQNCMVVRLGARNQIGSTNNFSLVPETHNVALLVLARKNASELQMEARTTFRNVLDNTVPEQNSSDLWNKLFLTNAIDGYILRHPDTEKLTKQMDTEADKYGPHFTEFRNFRRKLVNDVYDTNTTDGVTFQNFYNDFHSFFTNSAFTNYLGEPSEEHNFTNFDIAWLDSLWLDVTGTGVGDQYATDLVPLSKWAPHLPPKNQTVLYQDDGKSTTFVFGSNGRTFPVDKITAILTVTNPVGIDMKLYSHNVTFANDGTLSVEFNPLSEIEPLGSDSDDKTNQLKPEKIKLLYGHKNEDDSFTTAIYQNFAFLNKNKTNVPATTTLAWKILRTYGGLIAGTNNQFNIVLAPTLPAATNATWYLDVSNAIVITTNSPDGVLGRLVSGIYLLNFKTNNPAEVSFTLGPLPAGQTVDFNLLDSKEDLKANLNHQVVRSAN